MYLLNRTPCGMSYKLPCPLFRPRPLSAASAVIRQRLQAGRPVRVRAQVPPPPASSASAANSAASAQDLRELDTLLQQAASQPEKEDTAISTAERLQEEGVLRCFGAGRQVPKRSYTLEELRLNKIQPERFLAPKDNTLSRIRNLLQGSYLAGLTATYAGGALELSQVFQIAFLTFFLLAADQVGYQGGFEALAVDTAGRLLSPQGYARRVALHEAGHFLVAYLLGVLPRGYTLSALDAFRQARQFNVQAGTQFCDARFQREVASGQLSSTSLDKFSCVALAGVATEWLRYDHAEGGVADVQQLDALLRALRFSQAKADDQVRWAVLNVVSLLRRHAAVQDQLADAMERGGSVGECIAVIEKALAGSEDV